MPPQAHIHIADSRAMPEVEDASIDLALTSPPYWHLKDYAAPGQIGYGQTLHEYLTDLYRTWAECFRALRPGARLCVNVGDQFARSSIYGRYKVIPLHAEIIAQCEQIGFDFMGSIIWRKKTTMNTTGGAVVMGSFPYPPNGIVEIDYEHILIFKKPGKPRRVSKEIKEQSKLTKEQWKEYFHGHWQFGGARQLGHEAMFPRELPERLIRMFSFVGDTVLDPFLGSGTTLRAALELERGGVGYEINEDYVETMREKLTLADSPPQVTMVRRERGIEPIVANYTPQIQDAHPVADPKEKNESRQTLHKVMRIAEGGVLELEGGIQARLLGVKIDHPRPVHEYLERYVQGKQVYLKFDERDGYEEKVSNKNGPLDAYVYLKNRIFINRYLIKSGLASADRSRSHRLRAKFFRLGNEG